MYAKRTKGGWWEEYQKGFRSVQKGRKHGLRMKLERSAVSSGCGKPRIVFRTDGPTDGSMFMCLLYVCVCVFGDILCFLVVCEPSA